MSNVSATINRTPLSQVDPTKIPTSDITLEVNTGTGKTYQYYWASLTVSEIESLTAGLTEDIKNDELIKRLNGEI